jgi:DNA-directed RNA polymerase subunit M
MLTTKDNKLICLSCKTEKEILNRDDFKLREGKKKRDKVVIIEDDVQTLPTTRVECKKCGHMEAAWWFLQTRGADESETRFYRCTKCKHTWREYD